MTQTVKASIKFQKNLGNFNLIHIEMGVEDYVKPGETLTEALNRVYDLVDEEIGKRAAEIPEP